MLPDSISEFKELPYKTFREKSSLPTAPGIYFVFEGSELVYIGRAQNIKTRWAGHHVRSRLTQNAEIHYLELDINDPLDDIEQGFIQRYSPPFNKGSVAKYTPPADPEPIPLDTLSDLKAHLVLTTKYRRKVFTDEMLQSLANIVSDLCEKWDCKLIEVNGEADHLHILFQYYPQLELPKFIANLKSVSSRRMRSEYPERINQFYYKSVLWHSTYFIASCGGVTVSVLKRYIKEQGKGR